MSVNEMQQRIIDEIKKIEAPELLEKFYKLIQLETEEDKVYKIPDEQKNIIMEALADYEAGNYITQEDLDKEIDKWLEE